jgi:hypothetical protein
MLTRGHTQLHSSTAACLHACSTSHLDTFHPQYLHAHTIHTYTSASLEISVAPPLYGLMLTRGHAQLHSYIPARLLNFTPRYLPSSILSIIDTFHHQYLPSLIPFILDTSTLTPYTPTRQNVYSPARFHPSTRTRSHEPTSPQAFHVSMPTCPLVYTYTPTTLDAFMLTRVHVSMCNK